MDKKLVQWLKKIRARKVLEDELTNLTYYMAMAPKAYGGVWLYAIGKDNTIKTTLLTPDYTQPISLRENGFSIPTANIDLELLELFPIVKQYQDNGWKLFRHNLGFNKAYNVAFMVKEKETGMKVVRIVFEHEELVGVDPLGVHNKLGREILKTLDLFFPKREV